MNRKQLSVRLRGTETPTPLSKATANAVNVGALIARAERAEARIAATDKFCELQLAFAQIDDDAGRIRLLESVRESLALDNGADEPPARERTE